LEVRVDHHVDPVLPDELRALATHECQIGVSKVGISITVLVLQDVDGVAGALQLARSCVDDERRESCLLRIASAGVAMTHDQENITHLELLLG
jgi:hypothetical protein